MQRLLGRASVTIVVLIVLSVAWNRFRSSELTERVGELEREKSELSEYLRRICTSRRVAQIDVLDRGIDASGELVTRLSWQELEPDGVSSRPRFVEVLGGLVYVEALVIKFDYPHVAHGDTERGYSIAVFRRLFGDRQMPDSGPLLTPNLGRRELGTNGPPDDEALFARFWELVDDPSLAAEHGVRAAQCEAVGARLSPGEVWEITLDAAGGLNLKKLRQRTSG